MHNIYYLGLSGERSLPFGLLVLFWNSLDLQKKKIFFFHVKIKKIHVKIYRIEEPELFGLYFIRAASFRTANLTKKKILVFTS